MAPLVFDIDEGGHHDHNQEDDDHENNHLGEEMMVKGSTSPLDKPARLSVCQSQPKQLHTNTETAMLSTPRQNEKICFETRPLDPSPRHQLCRTM